MTLTVPLYVRPQFLGDTMKLERLEKGVWHVFDKPFKPYIYSRSPISNREGEKVERKLLSTHRPASLYRYEFDTTLPVAELNKEESLYSLLESHIRFTDRIAIDLPDFYFNFPYPSDLRPLVVDIEGLTRHGRPKGKWWVGCLDADGKNHQWALDSRTAFDEFSALVSQHDVVTGYNITNYDWPILQRLAADVRVVLPNTFLMYDVAHSVFADQTLHGIKSRGLKSVARWYGFTVTEIDTRNTANYLEEELMEYNGSDLHATRGLFDIYFPRLLAVSELTGLPVETVVEGEQYSSTLSSIICARGLYKKGYVSDGNNRDRHPTLGKAQGAFVSLSKAGLYNFLFKADFKQLYPSIILELNLGPDTTTIESVEPMKDMDPYSVRREGDVLYYRIPDANLGGMVTIAVRQDETSVLREYLMSLGQLRDEIKARLSGMSEGERARSPLHAQENAVKVLRNALYGYQLSDEARFADKGVGILVTATGREMIQAVKNHLDTVFGEGTAVECDTDGIFISAPNLTEEKVKIQSEVALHQWVHSHLLTDAQFVLAYESYPAGWFAAAKNYILLDRKGNIIRHGSGLKGTHRPNLEDKVVDDVGKKLLSGENVNSKPYYRWDQYTREDFLMRRTLGKNLADYDHNTVEKQVAEQLLYRGEPVETGQIMEYYSSTSGFRAYLAEDHEGLPLLKELDFDYHKKRLDRIFTSLGIKDILVTLDGYNGTFNATTRAIRKGVDAVIRGQYQACPRCHGQGWFLPRGKILPEDCNCEQGRVLVL